MKIRAIRLENVRQFIDPVEIREIGDGLNVLTAPNERGKSTFFDALHAVFFKDRKAWDREIRALVPHAGGDPSVMVEIKLPDGVFRIEKRWNKGRRGDVRILSDGRVFKQADDAQAWIAEILKSPKDGGPAGLLWVRQGQSGLDEGEATQRARRDLLTSVAGEVEAMTGGRRMDVARDLCRKERDRYLTKTGLPKADGPLKRAGDSVTSLQKRREDLEQRSGELRRELDRRRELRRELADLDDPEAEETRTKRLSEPADSARSMGIVSRPSSSLPKVTTPPCARPIRRWSSGLAVCAIVSVESRPGYRLGTGDGNSVTDGATSTASAVVRTRTEAGSSLIKRLHRVSAARLS